MSYLQPTSENFSTKCVDISLGDIVPADTYKRHFLNVNNKKATVGMQKLVDRFIITLLNAVGTTKHDQTSGTSLLSDILVGSSLNFGVVQSVVAIAVSDAEQQLIDEDKVKYKYASTPDEQLKSAVCDSVEYDTRTGTLRMYVTLTNNAGEDYTYILPANLALMA